MASGPLHRPKLPGIPGIEDFQGHTFHTSRWDYDYTGGDSEGNLTKLADKRVGIIGTGATAVQVVPAPRRGGRAAVRVPAHAVVDRRAQQPPDRPGVGGLARAGLAAAADGELQQPRHRASPSPRTSSATGGPTSSASCCCGCARPTAATTSPGGLAEAVELADFEKMEQIRARVDTIVNDPNTAEALKPYYRQFCKRPCFHDEYLDTYNRPNVTLVDTDGRGVDRITEHGVVVGETEYEIDCLIYATGFEVGTDFTRRAGLRDHRPRRPDADREVARRRVDAARDAHPRLPEPAHLQPTSSPGSRPTSRTPSTSRASTPPTSCATRSTTTSRTVEVSQEAEDAWVADDPRAGPVQPRLPRVVHARLLQQRGQAERARCPQRVLRRRLGGLLQGHRRLARRGLAGRAGAHRRPDVVSVRILVAGATRIRTETSATAGAARSVASQAYSTSSSPAVVRTVDDPADAGRPADRRQRGDDLAARPEQLERAAPSRRRGSRRDCGHRGGARRCRGRRAARAPCKRWARRSRRSWLRAPSSTARSPRRRPGTPPHCPYERRRVDSRVGRDLDAILTARRAT